MRVPHAAARVVAYGPAIGAMAGLVTNPGEGTMARPRILFHVLACVLAVGAGGAGATTWRVELDGSGDFTDLQPAVTAAAAGDTVLVGPGRFDTLLPAPGKADVQQAVVVVAAADLTIIGAGRDQTFIGPESWYGPVGAWPAGIRGTGDQVLRLRSLTVEHLPRAVEWPAGSVDLGDCVLRGGGFGFYGLLTGAAQGIVQDCAVETTEEDGFAVWLGQATSFTIADTRFDGPGVGVAVVEGSQGVSIAGCAFSGSFAAMTFGDASDATVSDCTSSGALVMSVSAVGGAHVAINGLFVDGGDNGISAGSGAVVTVHGSALEHTLAAGVTVTGDAVVTVHGSHLVPATGFAVSSFLYPGAPTVLDFTGNYWGTTDEAAIAALIHDSVDDAAIHCTVDFGGASANPLGETPTTWGDLKASFR